MSTETSQFAVPKEAGVLWPILLLFRCITHCVAVARIYLPTARTNTTCNPSFWCQNGSLLQIDSYLAAASWLSCSERLIRQLPRFEVPAWLQPYLMDNLRQYWVQAAAWHPKRELLLDIQSESCCFKKHTHNRQSSLLWCHLSPSSNCCHHHHHDISSFSSDREQPFRCTSHELDRGGSMLSSVGEASRAKRFCWFACDATINQMVARLMSQCLLHPQNLEQSIKRNRKDGMLR